MSRCTGCGTELPADAIFCPQCARPVSARGVATPGTRSGVATVTAPAGAGTISGTETVQVIELPKPAATLGEGAQFHGRYTVQRQIGAGAMGVVYAAHDQVTNKKVALKLISPALAGRSSARERFVREGLLARDVRHRNVVAMYDVGDADGQLYLVMEYLSGDSLRTWLHRTLQAGRDISFDVARGIIRSVLDGLAAAHAIGVVHRDLKPENVMLAGDPLDGNYSLKILDFGIARAVGQGAASHATTTASSTGTPLYMAPEQKTAADTVGPPADLYAVTAMLYELLLGVAPEGRWGAPSKERPDIPADVDAIVEKGLANRPRSRFQTAEEYVEALDRIGTVPRQPEPARPPEPVSPGPVPSPRALSSDWLLARSPAWALWNRLSRRQRQIAGAIGLLAIFAIIGLAAVADMTQTSSPDASGPIQDEGAGRVEPPPPPVIITGRWFDELTGTNVAVGAVDIVQQGSAVNGSIYDTFGNRAGTFSGALQGTSLRYDSMTSNGLTGSGSGRLAADGIHLTVDVQNHATRLTERHTLHKGHLPNQWPHGPQ